MVVGCRRSGGAHDVTKWRYYVTDTAPEGNVTGAGPGAGTVVDDRPIAPEQAANSMIRKSAAVPAGRTGVVSTGVPPHGLGAIGTLTLLLGAWAGIVPFVGPVFGYSADGTVSWYWSLPHALLWLVPGAVAFFCGLMMLGLIPRALVGSGRLGSATVGLLTALSGAWLVVGFLAWPVLRNSAGVFVPASPLKELAYQVGYSLGPGLLLGVFGGFAMGWALKARAVVGSEIPARTVGQPTTRVAPAEL
jgi:hypothetical protein